MFSKIAQNVTTDLDDFYKEICRQELKNIAQSGNTWCRLFLLSRQSVYVIAHGAL